MIETIVKSCLERELETGALGLISVFLEVPEDAPGRYIVLEKTGSSRDNRLDTATVAIQSCADSLYDAAVMNEEVKKIMDGLPYLADEVFSAKLNSDYNFSDVETKKRRYQAVFYITYKE